MTGKLHITPTIVIGWLTSIGFFIAGLAPILPAEAPEWMHVWLPVAGLVIALLTQSVRKLEPTPAEAVAVLATPEGRASMVPTSTDDEAPK